MKRLLLLSPLLLLFSCVTNQKIVYQTDDLAAPASVEPIPVMVEVHNFQDNRLSFDENDVLFEHPRQIMLEEKAICVNSEKHYKKEPVVNQIPRMMADHFNKARLFKLAVYDQSPYCDYYLTGTLNSFFGEQDFSPEAFLGSQFGLIGAIATAGVKSPGKIIIDISDLKLYRKDGKLVKDFGSFYKEYNQEFKADGYCWCVYWNVNAMLKDFNTYLIEKIRADMEGVEL